MGGFSGGDYDPIARADAAAAQATANGAVIDAATAQTTADLRAVSLTLNATRNVSLASGNVSYSGFGFRPKKVTIRAATVGGKQWSHGFCGVDGAGVVQNGGAIASDEANNMEAANSWLVGYFDALGSCVGALTSMDADGFTIAWTLAGTPSGTYTLIMTAEA